MRNAICLVVTAVVCAAKLQELANLSAQGEEIIGDSKLDGLSGTGLKYGSGEGLRP